MMTAMSPIGTTAPWPQLPAHRRWLEAECRRLLEFGRRVGRSDGGAAYLDDRGAPMGEQGVQTWITARMVHVYSLGVLLGIPGSGHLARTALSGLTGDLRDGLHGGWFHGLDPEGVPEVGAGKSCYDHAFVMIAAASAVNADLPGAGNLLAEATRVFLDKFWDDHAGLPVDSWDVGFTRADEYRGLNATMHSVEAMLAVADAVDLLPAAGTGSTSGVTAEATEWRERAARAASFVVGLVDGGDGRLPEHFTSAWQPEPDVNRDRPDDAFKPYGATPGHGLEWARLLLHLEAVTVPDHDLVAAAETLFSRAVADGWAVDGADGFVYTTDWDGTPIVRQRMHWVVAEAIGAAAALLLRTGKPEYAHCYATWWDYAERFLIDHEGGSWWHELDPLNRPTGTVWPGKPDLYHAVQATLIPRLPLAPTIARALHDGLLG